MKFPLLVFLVLNSFMLFSQTIPTAVTALGKGDVAALVPLFDETIEICIDDVPDLYNKKEARVKLSTFFKMHKPISFSRKHAGDSRGKDSQYVIGDLKTSDKLFRVYIYFKSVAGNKKIQELRFDTK